MYIIISTLNTRHMQRPDVLVQLGYIRRHVSAVKQPSSGQLRTMLLRYSQIGIQWDPIFYIKTRYIVEFLVINKTF